MKTNYPQSSVCRLLLLALLALGLPPGHLRAEENGSWKIQEIAGVEYIPLDQIRTFYRFDKSTRNESSLTLENPKIALKLEVGSTDCLINGIKVILAKPIVDFENAAYLSRTDLSQLLDPMLRPAAVISAGDFKTVILDPSRGGEDQGTANDFGTEAGYTLRIAEITKELLSSKGFKVVLTRENDGTLSPQERLELANSVGESAVFVGISFGAGPESERGIQTSPVARNDGGTAADPHGFASMALATAVHGTIIRKLGKNSADEGIKLGGPEVFSGIKHPAIVIQAGHMTHPYEARLIENEAYQKAIAAAIADGLARYRVAVTKTEPASAPAEP